MIFLVEVSDLDPDYPSMENLKEVTINQRIGDGFWCEADPETVAKIKKQFPLAVDDGQPDYDGGGK